MRAGSDTTLVHSTCAFSSGLDASSSASPRCLFFRRSRFHFPPPFPCDAPVLHFPFLGLLARAFHPVCFGFSLCDRVLFRALALIRAEFSGFHLPPS